MFNEKIRKSDENITSDKIQTYFILSMANQIWGKFGKFEGRVYISIHTYWFHFPFFFNFCLFFRGWVFFQGGGGLRWGGVSYYKIMKKILAEFEHN